LRFHQKINAYFERRPEKDRLVRHIGLGLTALFYASYAALCIWLWLTDREKLRRVLLVPAACYISGSLIRKTINAPRPADALLLGRYQSGNVYELTTFDLAGQTIAAIEITEEVLDLSACGEYLAVLYSNSLVIYTRDLVEHARLEGTDYAGHVRMEEDGTALVIAGSSAWRFLP
jgi:hypothetical protein